MGPISRRDFLRNVLVGGTAVAGGYSLLARLPSALADAPRPARKLVIVFVGGGWDVTYALDPKPGAAAIDVPDGVARNFGGLPILSHPSRPSVDAFFNAWGGACCVINGIVVRSVSHSECWKHVLTGTSSETNPDLGAIAAWELGRDRPVPYLVLGRTAFSGPYGAIAGRTGDINQISALVNDNFGFPPLAGEPEPAQSPFVKLPSASEDALIARYVEAATAREKAVRGMRGSNRRLLDDFVSSRGRGDRLRTLGGLGAPAYARTLDAQVDLAVDALASGLSWAVTIDSGIDWDTHTDNARQGGHHEALFAGLLRLANKLSSTSRLLDETVVAVVSEMSRTPRKNAQGGKDHWPVTSALVFGGGVRGGRVLGESDATLSAVSIDPSTGARGAAGQALGAANVVAGVVSAVGVDASAHLPGVASLVLV